VLNSDGRPAQDYPAGTIDVVAPGQNVASLATAGRGQVQVSGAQYAVALVAGAVALVRGAAPSLRADEVVERVRTTATPLDPEQTGQPAGQVLALVNPARAVAALAPVAPTPRAAAPVEEGGGRGGVLVVSVAVLALLALVGVLFLRRRRVLPTTEWSTPESSTPDDFSDLRDP
jgi:MYXO-CTERM domain-containing protein